MSGNHGNRRAELAKDIRRQAGSEATKRFLRALPAFRLEKEVPRRLSDLLDRLDEAENADGGRPSIAARRHWSNSRKSV